MPKAIAISPKRLNARKISRRLIRFSDGVAIGGHILGQPHAALAKAISVVPRFNYPTPRFPVQPPCGCVQKQNGLYRIILFAAAKSHCVSRTFADFPHAIAEAAPQKIPNEGRLDLESEMIDTPDLVLALGRAVFVAIHGLSPCPILNRGDEGQDFVLDSTSRKLPIDELPNHRNECGNGFGRPASPARVPSGLPCLAMRRPRFPKGRPAIRCHREALPRRRRSRQPCRLREKRPRRRRRCPPHRHRRQPLRWRAEPTPAALIRRVNPPRPQARISPGRARGYSAFFPAWFRQRRLPPPTSPGSRRRFRGSARPCSATVSRRVSSVPD